MSVITLNGVSRLFGTGENATGLRGIDLEVEEGEFVTLLGPSGCGKTTTLRCIAGLEKPDRGEITIEGRTVVSAGARNNVFVAPENRHLSMVFQNYALWPHMSVAENVAFGLRRKKRPKAEVDAAVKESLRMIGLPDIAERRVSELSGGQQQRVALARAMAPRPSVVLFDEPLSNIDTRLRESMRIEVLRLQRETGVTVVWVTHDQEEALSMSSRIVVMNDGRVEQIGIPSELWQHPASEFVAEFMGSKNVFRGSVVDSGDGSSGARVRIAGGHVLTVADGDIGEPDAPVSVCVSAADVLVSPNDETATNTVSAEVVANRFHGDAYQLVLQLDGVEFRARSRFDVIGDRPHVSVRFAPDSLMVLGKGDAARERTEV